jgi:hypothetical protein
MPLLRRFDSFEASCSMLLICCGVGQLADFDAALAGSSPPWDLPLMTAAQSVWPSLPPGAEVALGLSSVRLAWESAAQGIC